MSNNFILTNSGKIIANNRTFKGTPSYTPPSQFKVGINQTTPNVTDTALDYVIPIENGTVNDDGDNQMTGSSGGDNSTDNTTTYKPGAGVADNTSQNLIANDTNVTKIWTIANLAALGTNITGTEPFALWLYIKDSTALAKFEDAGTVLEVKLGSDSGNYYSETWDKTDLAVGWNWITSNTVNVEDMTETGTVAGNIDTFLIEITTNNATDEFVAGDVIYDLLRQWASTDLVDDIDSTSPEISEADKEVTITTFLSTLQANGFDINAHTLFNEDGTPLMFSESVITAESKSDTDQFSFTSVFRQL